MNRGMCYKWLSALFSIAVLFSGCHAAEEGQRIERLEFQEKVKTVKAGQIATVGIKVFPESAKTAETIKYAAANPGVVEIDEKLSSNDGVVFKAKGGTSTVITAKAQGVVDYLQVSVEGVAGTGVPYITVTDSVLEVPVGTKKHFMGTLQNGDAGDYLSFVFSNREQGIIDCEKANNAMVVTGLKPGSDVVTIKHPKAQYGVDVLVFVVEAGEFAKYVTGENVVFMETGNQREYYTRLVGIGESEAGYSVYQVIEGNDVVTVSGSGEFCHITSKKEGVAKVRVTNRSAPYPFDFQVMVRGNEELSYISMSSNLVILEDAEIRNIYAYYHGNSGGDIDGAYKWHFENNVNDIAEVTRYGNNFAVKALKNGSVKLIIENEYSLVKQEVLIIVQFAKITSGEMFITTSQNVMHMELGDVDSVLKMKLVGGTHDDKNNFEWVVEDSSVIEAAVPGGHGVVYHRAMASFNGEIQEAEAKIKAKKAGTTYIIVTNSSAPRSEVRVLVKVYPKGMFSGNTVSLGGEGLLKVKKGGTLDVNVWLLGGSWQNTGELLWHIKDESVVATSAAGMSGVITGLKAGNTELTVTGQNVLGEYRAVIVVYEEGQEDSVPYIYAERLNYKMYLGQVAWAYIYHPNIGGEEDYFDFSVINTNTQSVYTKQMDSAIVIYAVEPGEAELVISTGIPGCNSLVFTVCVELAEIDTERPYVITGDSCVVTYAGGTLEYNIIMAGASESDKSKIVWTIDDASVASLEMANGTHVVLRGLQKGQTVLRASNVKSANVKEVIVFVAMTQSDTYSKITLGLAKINYVLQTGESFFVKLVTNATENQKLQIRWGKSDADILEVQDNYDTAFVTALEEGTCLITVDTRDQSHVMPLVLYVTVRSPVFDEFEAAFPASVAIVKGQSKIIKGNMPGGKISGFVWNLENDDVVHVIADGLEATLWGRNAGQTFLTVTCYGFSKKILVICVDNENDLEHIWYFNAEKTYYRIKKNEEARISLLFGVNGFPEDEKKKIDWKNDLNNNVITLSSSGGTAKVTGKNPGVARIIASHEKAAKEIEILVEVIDTVSGSDEYYLLFPSVNRMLAGVPQTIPLSLYKDDHLYAQGYKLLSIKTEGKGIVEAELLNDTLRIVGWREGREYVTLSHPLAGERRMLVVVYTGQIPSDGDPVIYVDKTYWSLYEGRNEFIDLRMAGGNESSKDGILWVNNDPKIISLDSSNKTRVKVSGLSFGGAEVDILYNGNLVEKIYVSVAKGGVNTDIAVSTESIIIMALDTDERHLTKAIGGGNVSEFEWSIEDKDVAKITGYGYQCLLQPQNVGVTELTLCGNNYERKIIVAVVRTEAEKMNSSYLNIDKRYYKLRRGESTVIYPYYKAVKPSVAANNPVLHYNSGVVSVEREDEGIVITGKNAGIELVTISNGQCENEITIAVEVGEEISGGVVENTNLVYMTTENNLMIVTPNTYGILVKLDVIGEYFGTNTDFIWSKDSILAEWEASGTTAFLNTKEKTGEINITVENKYCQHPLKIKIIIEEEYAVTGNPYVDADRAVYRFALADDAQKISFRINNMEAVDYSKAVFTKTGNAVEIKPNGSYFEVKTKTQGVSELEIGYPGAVSLKLYFIVADSVENTAIYLTTAMNYVVVPKSKTKVIDVSLVNYTELNSDNIKWSSSDYNTVTVVGNGRTVQVYGVRTGFAKLTVKHPASYNDLEIMVKVIEENDVSNVAYLTTNENIIETYVQNNTLQVSVSKVGGKIPELETTWTVDDPTIVSVLGSGATAYLVPKKAGLALITVTEKETEKLDIVVIVKEAKAGTEYITTEEPIVQINPGTPSSKTVNVRLVGGNEMDTKDFEWQVYSQLPSDYEVAKNGGTVISLFGMGDRATVQGNYVGTAKIRVSHPKAQSPLYIAVQVTNFNTLSFNEKEAVIVNGEIYFAGIRIPNYENFTGKVEYSTDNAAVCVVTGSDKVALLQSQGVGKANITAVVRGTDLQAVIAVSVIERDNYAEANIIVTKTTYLLNPRERPFQIEAYLQGAGVTRESHNGIEWEAMLYNGTDQAAVWNAISIYPSVVKEKELYSGEKVEVLLGTGPIIQIEVLNEKLPEGKTFEPKEIVIVVRQPELTSRTKTIYIKISEISGIFTLDRSDIVMEPQNMVDLSCTILGGKASDYNEVVWISEVDNVGRKIVEIMPGKGRNVMVYGVNDGTVYVTALYRNEIAECRVQVKSSAYLKLQYEVFFTYPGARSGNNQPVEVEYEVRPFTQQILWTPRGPTPDSEDPVALVEPVMQDWNTGKGKIRITPLKEGSFEIIGMTNRQAARMTVLIKNVYRLQISHKYWDMQPEKETFYEEPKPEPYWDYVNRYKPAYYRVDGLAKVGDSIHIPFIICPPDHRLVFKPGAVKLMNNYGIEHEISPILKFGEMEGRGIIKLVVKKEIPNTGNSEGLKLELDLLKPLEDTPIDPDNYSSSPNNLNNFILVTSKLPHHQTMVIPVFQRVYGKYSNTTGGVPASIQKYKFYDPLNSANNYLYYKTLTNDSANVNNPEAFDINTYNWKKNPTGVLSEFNNADFKNSTSEYIKLDTMTSTNLGHTAYYNLEIGDGEKHYILLDQTHTGMYCGGISVNVADFNKAFEDNPIYKGKRGMAPTAELAEINGRSAILIEGGKDFLVYDRVLVKNRRKIIMEYYSKNTNTNNNITDVSEKTEIHNYKKDLQQFNGTIGGKTGAVDYFLVKQFGIPLNTTEEDNFEYNIISRFPKEYDEEGNEVTDSVYKEESVFKNTVISQIVYIREADKHHPIRVQYKYTESDASDEAGKNLIYSSISVIGNDGGYIDFANAKDFFKEGALYVTWADPGSGLYYITDRIPRIVNGNIQGYDTRNGMAYGLNTVVSNINAINPYSNKVISHEDMSEYNPHFLRNFNEALYIVSDFDLGKEGIMYYKGISDYKHIRTYPPSNQPGSTMDINVDWDYERGHTILTSRNYMRYGYTLIDKLTGNKIGNTLFSFHADFGGPQKGGDGSGDFLNLNYGTGHYFDFSTGNHYKMLMNDDSSFNGNIEFDRIEKHKNYRRGGFGASDFADYPIDSFLKVNWRAIIEVLKYNGKSDIIDLDMDYNITSFTAALQNKRLSFDLLGNAEGTIMGSYYDTYQNAVYHSNQSGIPTLVRPASPSYIFNTLYVKREREMGHNKIYKLKEFDTGDNFFIFDAHTRTEYFDNEFIMEDITGDAENYAPVNTESSEVVYGSVAVPLVITYKNSYRDDNKITINIYHKIRANHNSGESVETEWDKVKAVKSFEIGGKTFHNYSKIYNYNNQGYFFVNKEY